MNNLDFVPERRECTVSTSLKTLGLPIQGEVKAPRMETITTTAEILNLPVHFIRTKVKNGDVVAVRAGRKFLVNVDSVIAFLSTGIPQGAASAKAVPQTETAQRITPISLR